MTPYPCAHVMGVSLNARRVTPSKIKNEYLFTLCVDLPYPPWVKKMNGASTPYFGRYPPPSRQARPNRRVNRAKTDTAFPKIDGGGQASHLPLGASRWPAKELTT